MTTKTEAVNSVLRAVGKFDQAEAGANDWSTAEGASGSSMASYAERFLMTAIIRHRQSAGTGTPSMIGT